MAAQLFSYLPRGMGHGVHGRVSGATLDAETVRQVAETMQALATPSRLLILARLRDGACSVGELAAAVGMEGSAVSHQLRLLRHLGLVHGDRHGRRVVYALHDSHVGDLLEQAVHHVEHLRLGERGIERAAS
jgi:DNA-binding transcriptional ArsR family regulator